jgi:hypothetical protein
MSETHLSKETSHPLDVSVNWRRGLEPPSFDLRMYQRRVDEIVGRACGGLYPIIRVVWAPTAERMIFGRSLPTYVAETRDGGELVPPARWIFEERFEPEQYAAAWEASRFVQDPDTGRTLDRGAAPRDGWYGYLRLAASHDANCCQKRWETDRLRCWGYYREPNDDDLARLAYAKRMVDVDKLVKPLEVFTERDLAQIQLEANAEAAHVLAQIEAMGDAKLDDFLKTHQHRVADFSPKRLKHGRYSYAKQFFSKKKRKA